MRGQPVWVYPSVLLCVALLAAVAFWRRAATVASGDPERAVVAGANEPAAPPAEPPASTTPDADDAPRDPMAAFDESAVAWSKVDLESLRTEMPNNLYWKMASPTKDPETLRWRQEERDRWNVEYGKVLSNTATAEEIDTYYAYRYRLSSDYVQFATYLLTDHGNDIPPRDVALLKLAIEMHMARLEEIPRQTTEAHERARAHDAARRAWQEEQQLFAAPAPPPPSR